MNTELLFQRIISMNQLSICAVVTNYCYKFALTKDDKEPSSERTNYHAAADTSLEGEGLGFGWVVAQLPPPNPKLV